MHEGWRAIEADSRKQKTTNVNGNRKSLNFVAVYISCFASSAAISPLNSPIYYQTPLLHCPPLCLHSFNFIPISFVSFRCSSTAFSEFSIFIFKLAIFVISSSCRLIPSSPVWVDDLSIKAGDRRTLQMANLLGLFPLLLSVFCTDLLHFFKPPVFPLWQFEDCSLLFLRSHLGVNQPNSALLLILCVCPISSL